MLKKGKKQISAHSSFPDIINTIDLKLLTFSAHCSIPDIINMNNALIIRL